MAYYTALQDKWATLTGTTAEKLSQINALTVATGVPGRALLEPSTVLNAIVPADLVALTQLQVLQLSLLLSGAQVDASANTTIRLAVQTLFAGKTTTLQNLAALVAPFDNPTVPWWQANGYLAPITYNDCVAAGIT